MRANESQINFLLARIEALEKLNEMQTNLIDEQAKIIDEMQFKYADSKARFNMLIREIKLNIN
jgi:uncharacterized protein YydD (DUF2326 family)